MRQFYRGRKLINFRYSEGPEEGMEDCIRIILIYQQRNFDYVRWGRVRTYSRGSHQCLLDRNGAFAGDGERNAEVPLCGTAEFFEVNMVRARKNSWIPRFERYPFRFHSLSLSVTLYTCERSQRASKCYSSSAGQLAMAFVGFWLADFEVGRKFMEYIRLFSYC